MEEVAYSVIVCVVLYILYRIYSNYGIVYLVKKTTPQSCIVSSETLEDKLFVSEHGKRWTSQWSEVRNFSYIGALWFVLMHRGVKKVYKEMEVLLNEKGDASFSC